MPPRVLVLAPRALLLLGLALPARAQLITVKTLPIAEGDQFRIFPSANVGMAGVSIALADSTLDPFVNPAKGMRSLRGASKALFSGAPTFYSLSDDAGGGQTIPLSALARRGNSFGAVAVAFQEIDRIDQVQSFPVPLFDAVGQPIPIGTSRPSRQNGYAFASFGHELPSRGLTFAASALVSHLNDIDGTELLYAGSQDIRQRGGTMNLRLGALKEWTGGATFEALVLHDRFDMRHDVTWADPIWDPNTRGVQFRARTDHNVDATNTWGLHLNYSRPLADSGWRVGATATTNLMSHPHLPEYRIEQVRVIPWDPGHTAAYNLGVGVSKTTRMTTLGLDAVYEPIRTHTWGELPAETQGPDGSLLPAGSKTTENWFRFSNAIFRAGVSQELPIDTTQMRLRLQLGAALHSIGYSLRQFDHLASSTRHAREGWTEWSKTWGLSMYVTGVELRYVGLHSTGTGRPGIVSDGIVSPTADALSSSSIGGGRNILSAPNGPLTLTGVTTTTHQISVSVPVR